MVAQISTEEMHRRHQITESVLGTHAMEGLFPDDKTLALMRKWERGELTSEELSGAMDAHAMSLTKKATKAVGAA